MIKKVTLLKTIKNKFELPVDLFKIEPSLPYNNEQNIFREAEFLIGGFYKTIGYPMCAFYSCDREGNILDFEPIIMEEGINTYQEVFKNLGYTLI